VYTNKQKLEILKIANSNVSTGYSIDATKVNLENKQKNINNHQLAFFDKFVIALFYDVLYRSSFRGHHKKRGLGLPIIFAVLIFISFHFINTFGRK
jgi:lipopolysaccharide export system permease protein